MSFTFQDIDKDLKDGQNMGGIPQVVYFGFHKDVETWPSRPENPSNVADLGKLTGSVVMKAGTNMFKLYLTDDTGELEMEPVGEKDGKSFVMHLRLFTPGLHDKVLGFMNASKNENLVFIVPDNNGFHYLMGDELRPATYEGADDVAGTSKETAGRRGMSMHFSYKTANLYEYTGDIPVADESPA